MKTITSAIVLSFAISTYAYAETVPGNTTQTVPATTAPAAAPAPASQSTIQPLPKPVSKPASQPKHAAHKPASNQNSSSVYESIRSGWNSFIDVLTGPATSK